MQDYVKRQHIAVYQMLFGGTSDDGKQAASQDAHQKKECNIIRLLTSPQNYI